MLYDAAGLPPLFSFQEGADPEAEIVFRKLAGLTRGACAKFDSSAARELAELLRAVAAFAAGGMRALTDLRTEGARRLLILTEIRKQRVDRARLAERPCGIMRESGWRNAISRPPP